MTTKNKHKSKHLSKKNFTKTIYSIKNKNKKHSKRKYILKGGSKTPQTSKIPQTWGAWAKSWYPWKSTNVAKPEIPNNYNDEITYTISHNENNTNINSNSFEIVNHFIIEKNIDLSNKGINDKAIIQISDKLQNNPKFSDIITINLSNNQIGEIGIAGIALLLYSENSNISILDLSNNNIGSIGALQISKTLNYNTTLTHIDISNNQIDDSGAIELSKSLNDNITLTELNLSNNNISSIGSQAIIRALFDNTYNNFTQLNLSNNKIDPEYINDITENDLYDELFQTCNIIFGNIPDKNNSSTNSLLKNPINNIPLINNIPITNTKTTLQIKSQNTLPTQKTQTINTKLKPTLQLKPTLPTQKTQTINTKLKPTLPQLSKHTQRVEETRQIYKLKQKENLEAFRKSKGLEIKSKLNETIKQNGIIIGDKVIKSISGPISFYYLKPKKEFESLLQYFPLIILFGDTHRSKINACTNCYCSLDSKSCCYTISDPKFLQLLDTLPDDNHPVDFYTETSLLGTTGFKNGFMENLTTKNMVYCYQKTLRNTNNYRSQCPTTQIRWQAGNSRLFGGKLKDMFNNKKRKYSNKNNIVKQMLNKTYKNNNKPYITKISKKYSDNSYIEFQFYELNNLLYQLLTNIIDNKNKTIVTIIIMIRKSINNSVFGDIDEFTKVLNTLYDKTSEQITFDNFAKTLFDMMTEYNSLIYKQILKQDYSLFKDKEYWKNIYTKSILANNQNESFKTVFSIKYLKILDKDLLYLKTIIRDINDQNINHYITNIDIDRINRLNIIISYIKTYICAPFLDIYTLTRIFKQPSEGIRSSLSFCYFGNEHVKNIVSLLKKTDIYELVHSIDKKNVKDKEPIRCLDLNFQLNITEEINKHNSIVDSNKS